MTDARRQFLAWLDGRELPRSQPYACPYLSGRTARQFGFAAERFDPELYHDLMDRGYRRNGTVFYGMDCPECRQCVPLRVPVDEHRMSRSQRRTCRKNQDVRVEFGRPTFRTESFELYLRYLRYQHADPPAAESEQHFRDSLYRDVVDSLEVRYLIDDRLVGVSLLDVCSRSVSAVYHFFEPDEHRRSLGVYSAITEIRHARSIGVPFYYLGYWIERARTMSYKADYRPNELLIDGAWKRDVRTAT